MDTKDTIDTTKYTISNPLKSTTVAVGVVAIVYILFARLSFLLTGNISPIFPSAGIALAAVLIFGRPASFGVWLGSSVSSAFSFFPGTDFSLPAVLTALLLGIFIGIGAMSGATAGAFLIRRFSRNENPLYSGWNVIILVVVGALGCCMISPIVGVFSLSIMNYIPWERFGYSWLTWWLGDAAGVIIITPLILAWYHKNNFRMKKVYALEAILLACVTLLLCHFVFFRNFHFEYILLPLLLWAAFRFSMRGVTAAAALIAIFATLGTIQGRGPFVGDSINETLQLLYSFLGVTIVCSLFLAGILAERKRSEDWLQSKDELIQKEKKNIQTLLDISSGLYFARSFTDIGKIVSDTLEKYKLGGPIGIKLAVYDSEEDLYQVVYFNEEQSEEIKVKFKRTLQPCKIKDVMYYSKIAILQKEILLIQDNQSDYSLGIDIRQKDVPRGSMVFIPLFRKEVLIGLLSFARAPENSIDQDFLDFLVSIGEFVSISIDELLGEKRRKIIENEIIESEKRYHSLFENMLEGLSYCRMLFEDEKPDDFVFLEVNNSFEKLTGLKNVIDKRITEILPDIKESNFEILNIFGKVALNGIPERFETYIDILKSWFFISVYSPEKEYFVAVYDNITAQKLAENALRYERDRAQSYLNTVETIIIGLNPEGKINTINRKGCQILGYTEDELIDKFWFTTCLPQPEGIECAYPKHLKMIAGEIESEEYFENPIITRSGEVRQIAWHNALLRDEQGKIIGTLSSGDDITDRKLADEQLKKAKEEAELANRAKSEFLANVSHELRTPLNVILGYSDMLSNKITDTNQLGYIKIIHSNCYSLLSIINDVLDISRMASGDFAIYSEFIYFRNMISDLVIEYKPMANEKGLEFYLDIDTEFPEKVSLNEDHIKRALKNLLDNAIKFTEEGSIKFSAKHKYINSKNDEAEIILIIEDTGIGIEEHQIKKIFDPFFQSDGTSSRKYGGTGLGLAVTKRFVKLMRGNITVESEVKKGSKFSIFFSNLMVKNIPDSTQQIQRVIEEVPEIPKSAIEEMDLSPEKYKEFKSELDKYTDTWKVLTKTLQMNAVKEFAGKLNRTANEYGSIELLNYSNNLSEFANSLKVIKIKNLLSEFPKIIEIGKQKKSINL